MIYLDRHVMTPHEFGVEIERICEEYENKLDIANQYAKKTYEEIKTAADQLKDENFKKLVDKQALVYGSFTYPQEKERWVAFCEKHKKCHPLDQVVRHRKIPYVIPCHTDMGTYYIAICATCGAKEDLTYIEGW